ncbi:MAG: hypothetical protein JWO09_3575 [Bacteroidetes bacterium]|nr:hypothetical protein [Bacteroidota bacterium]
MVAKEKKKLILSLIKDSLINTKLINGLNNLGLDSDQYSLHLGDTIFGLLGFENERAEVYERFMKLSLKVNKIDISKNDTALDGLALEIYNELETNLKEQ